MSRQLWSDMEARTHEPSLRELTAELDGLRELMNERDKWYASRDSDRQLSVEKALTAAKEQTATAFSTSKDAREEAKKAQDTYNATHNDLVRKMERQASELITRAEVDTSIKGVHEREEAEHKNLREKLEVLDREIRLVRETVGTGTGKSQGTEAMWNKAMQLLQAMAALGIGVYIGKQ